MDWSTVIIAAVAGLPAIIIALATLITAIKTNTKTADLAKSIDGHMTNLIDQTKIISEAKGKSEGIVEGIVKGVEMGKPTIITDRREK